MVVRTISYKLFPQKMFPIKHQRWENDYFPWKISCVFFFKSVRSMIRGPLHYLLDFTFCTNIYIYMYMYLQTKLTMHTIWQTLHLLPLQGSVACRHAHTHTQTYFWYCYPLISIYHGPITKWSFIVKITYGRWLMVRVPCKLLNICK